VGFQAWPSNPSLVINDIFTTTTGSFQTMFLGHMKKLKNNAIVGNIGYCDDEIKVV
jgi:adenosylhomocysteinase